MKKQENESSGKFLEAVKCLFREASIDIPVACIDRANRVSRTDDTVTSTLYNISSPHYVLQEKEGIEKRVNVHLDLTKARLDLLIKASKYVNSLSNVDFVYADINCQLKIHFSNNNESFLTQCMI